MAILHSSIVDLDQHCQIVRRYTRIVERATASKLVANSWHICENDLAIDANARPQHLSNARSLHAEQELTKLLNSGLFCDIFL